MAKHLEIEYKNLLSKQEFHKIKDHFNIKTEDFFLQENEYFDTPDFSLKNLGCALRIRKKHGTFEFTLKEPQKVGLLETNESLSAEERSQFIHHHRFPKGAIAERLSSLQIPLENIVYFGTLKTYRAEWEYMDGILVLDKSHYLNKVDYEIEYEVKEPVRGKKVFLKLLAYFQIPQRRTPNKIERFYMEWEKENNKN